MMPAPTLSLAQIEAAHERIRPHVHLTPVLTCASLDALTGATLFFKAENFQKIGAFKARGATNAIFALAPEIAAKGVITHSSGNHGAAVARAARLRGITAHVVMPSNTPKIKVANVEAQGGRVVTCEPNLASREAAAARVQAETGATLIHPYNDLHVMAGQGTAALELVIAVPDLDLMLCPVGGGGLLSGTAVATKGRSPQTRVIGVEPAQADDAARSFHGGSLLPSGKPDTIADGLRGALGDLTYAEITTHVDDIVTVSEAAIIAAMRLIWERMKIIVEPSCAVPLAGLLENRIPDIAGRRIGIILTGGNVDLDRLPWQTA